MPAKKTSNKKAVTNKKRVNTAKVKMPTFGKQEQMEGWNTKLTSTVNGKRLQMVLGVFFGYQAHYAAYPFIGRLSSLFGRMWIPIYVIAWAWLATVIRRNLAEEMPEFGNIFYYAAIAFSVVLILGVVFFPPLNIFSSFLGL